MLNNEKGTYEERLTAITVLCQLGATFVSDKQRTPINELKIIKQDSSGALLAYYIQYCIRSRQEYTHLMPVLL